MCSFGSTSSLFLFLYHLPTARSSPPKITNVITITASLSHDLILLGDFNINFLDNTHPLFTKLLIITSSLSLSQIVSEPTHFPPLIPLLTLSFCLHLRSYYHVRPYLPWPILTALGFRFQLRTANL